MSNFTAGFDQDGFFATGDRGRKASAFEADAREEGGERIEVSLSINFEGVLMTLGAIESNSKKELADHGNDFVRFTAVTEDRNSTVFPVATPGREYSSNELIVGDVLTEGIADPGVEAKDGFDTDAIGIRA